MSLTGALILDHDKNWVFSRLVCDFAVIIPLITSRISRLSESAHISAFLQTFEAYLCCANLNNYKNDGLAREWIESHNSGAHRVNSGVAWISRHYMWLKTYPVLVFHEVFSITINGVQGSESSCVICRKMLKATLQHPTPIWVGREFQDIVAYGKKKS